MFGPDHAAEPAGFFVERPLDLSSAAFGPFQIKSSAQAGNAAADNRDAFHDAGLAETSAEAAELIRDATRLARAEMKLGDVFRDSGRHNDNPCSAANCRNPISTS